MKKILNPANLPWLVLTAGGIGIGLRYWLLSTGIDANNLFETGHPADILLWVLTVVLAALVIYGCLPLIQANKYAFNFPPAILGAVGEGIFALGILSVSIEILRGVSDSLSSATVILGFLSVPALVCCAVCRWKGKQPPLFLHALVCIFFLMRLISLYRVWSPESQLQSYIFQLFANVFLLLSCYHRTAFDAACGLRRSHALTHLAATYFCCLSLVGCQNWFLYATGIVWSITDLCRLNPMPGWKYNLPKKDIRHEPS